MIKAILFDFYETIVTFDPPREELQAEACREFGVEVDPQAIPRAYWVADDFLSRENAHLYVQQRSPEELKEFWASYEAVLLKEAGVEVSRELALRIVTRLRQLDRGLVLFNDVLPVMKSLKARSTIFGLISNLNRPLGECCSELGLAPYIDFAITSSEVGSEKPHPPIFLAALERAGVSPSEAIHVGDQYNSDVVGAKGAGINPLLLDRHGFWGAIDDCPRISSLSEIMNYL